MKHGEHTKSASWLVLVIQCNNRELWVYMALVGAALPPEEKSKDKLQRNFSVSTINSVMFSSGVA